MPNARGKNVTVAGKYVMTNNTTIITQICGIISRIISFNGVPEIPDVMNSSIPNGGVLNPTIMLNVTTTPK